jgi:3-deoxy-manno-octulosonate cytidylyltransferase (CMP-KDO synthetase)
MKCIAMIPARMGSSRFPGKPLAALRGRPMIEHIYHRVRMCELLADTFIATCDEEIRSAAAAFGARAIMTGAHHERATDRIAEAMAGLDADVVVMVQGDEPMVVPEMIEAALQPYRTKGAVPACVNLAKRIDSEAEFRSPNTIKVVTDLNHDALFMTRAPIPTLAPDGFAATRTLKQVCIMPFTRQALADFAALAPTPLEKLESIDMLRFLEHGRKVRMIETVFDSQAVDTPADLALVEALMQQDALCARY